MPIELVISSDNYERIWKRYFAEGKLDLAAEFLREKFKITNSIIDRVSLAELYAKMEEYHLSTRECYTIISKDRKTDIYKLFLDNCVMINDYSLIYYLFSRNFNGITNDFIVIDDEFNNSKFKDKDFILLNNELEDENQDNKTEQNSDEEYNIEEYLNWLVEMGDYESVVSYIDNIIEGNIENASLPSILATADKINNFDESDISERLAYFKRYTSIKLLSEIAEEKMLVEFKEAIKYYDEDLSDKALKIILKLQAKGLKSDELVNLKMLCLQDLDRTQEATELAKMIIKKTPNLLFVWELLFINLDTSGKEKCYGMLKNINWEELDDELGVIRILVFEYNILTAIDYTIKCINKRCYSSSLLLILGKLYYLNGNMDKARDCFVKINKMYGTRTLAFLYIEGIDRGIDIETLEMDFLEDDFIPTSIWLELMDRVFNVLELIRDDNNWITEFEKEDNLLAKFEYFVGNYTDTPTKSIENSMNEVVKNMLKVRNPRINGVFYEILLDNYASPAIKKVILARLMEIGKDYMYTAVIDRIPTNIYAVVSSESSEYLVKAFIECNFLKLYCKESIEEILYNAYTNLVSDCKGILKGMRSEKALMYLLLEYSSKIAKIDIEKEIDRNNKIFIKYNKMIKENNDKN